MAVSKSGRLPSESDESRSDTLDPRICVELEKLNKASENINTWELELDEARLLFRHILSDSTQQLNDLSKKLGSCIDKSRPYYEARIKLKEAQTNVQNAALRFDRACSQLAAAKEMVNLAEQGYFNHGQPFDPAWQEMLNHATMKVNEAEQERLQSEAEHELVTQTLNDAEVVVKKLQRDWRRNIAKSRPYFELKAKVNQRMEEQKRKVGELENKISKAKAVYAQTLHNLEKISDDIHRRRRRRERWQQKQREKIAKNPNDRQAIFHPLLHSSEEDSDDANNSSEPASKSDVTERVQSSATSKLSAERNGQKPVVSTTVKSPTVSDSSVVTTECSKATRSTPSDASSAALSPLSDSIIMSPIADVEQIKMNADVMAAVWQTKQQRDFIGSPFLRPNSRDELRVDGSETDSVSGSFVSGCASMLDDEQIESLMRDTSEYRRIVSTMDRVESDHFHRLPLPARLRHLRDYFNFEPNWDDDDSASMTNDSREFDVTSSETSGVDCRSGGSASNAVSVECCKTVLAETFDDSRASPVGQRRHREDESTACNRNTSAASLTISDGKCQNLPPQLSTAADGAWHPLADASNNKLTVRVTGQGNAAK